MDGSVVSVSPSTTKRMVPEQRDGGEPECHDRAERPADPRRPPGARWQTAPRGNRAGNGRDALASAIIIGVRRSMSIASLRGAKPSELPVQSVRNNASPVVPRDKRLSRRARRSM